MRILISLLATVAAMGIAVAAPRATALTIPLCKGLTIVTAIAEPEGDYESIKTVQAVDATGVHLQYSVERILRDIPGHPIQKFKKARFVRAADLREATRYMQEYATNIPDEIPGATAVGISSAILTRLKETGSSELTLFDMPAFKSTTTYSVDRKASPNVYEYELPFKLRRVESPASLAITVNGEKVQLPVIHALGTAEWGEKSEFYFLDDPANPLTLSWSIRSSSISMRNRGLQVVRIGYQCNPRAAASPLETALLERGRADVYEIFFSFNSDEIRDDSEPVLRELGDILTRHPDWKLSIEGHTDGIASDTFNLDLSKRRAAAVKKALVTRFNIADARLTTAGYGKSRPKDTNDTPEGRARNRRVELVRY